MEFFSIAVVCVAVYAAWRRFLSQTKQSGDGVDISGELQINGFYPIINLSRFWNMVLFFVVCGLVIIMGYFGNTAFIYGKF